MYVLDNDKDDDLTTNPDTERIRVHSVTDEDENATIVAAGDGLSVLVTPRANYNGPVSFTYTIEDAEGEVSNIATATVSVYQVNDAPDVVNDTATTAEDTATDILVLGNDSDIDMDSSFNFDPDADAESIGVTIDDSGLTPPDHGSITTDGLKITYTPKKDYNGTDTFDYNCYDGEAKTKGTVTVTITQTNDDPIAVNDSIKTDEDTEVRVDVLANDTDVDTENALNQNVLHSEDSFSIERYSISGTAHGTLTKEGNTLIFDPDPDFSGTQVIEICSQRRTWRNEYRHADDRCGFGQRHAARRERRNERAGGQRCVRQCADKRHGRRRRRYKDVRWLHGTDKRPARRV